MKNLKKILSFFLITISFNCATDLDDNPVSNTDINDFIYRGLRTYYLYNENVPDLVNDKTASSDYQSYLSQSSPEDFFENLIFDRQNVDRFSWLTNDYLALEQQFQGLSTTNGMEFGLIRTTPSGDDIFGFVKYVLPNTSASSQGVTRGMLFTAINNTNLTVSNFRTLLSNDTYSINLATYNATTDQVEPNGQTITLSKQVYNENPVFISNTFTVDTETVGYLMYNGFTANFNSQLNAAFGNFASSNIDQLVLDLRYNPGGSVNSATLLASMITGQFNGQTFSRLNYNSLLSANNVAYNFTNSFDGETINSLNLSKVYVLTSGNTASASEMIINSLKAYINVVQIGTNTVGKSQASVTLYDSPDFSRSQVNPTHLYAMQPLVAATTDVNNVGVPVSGITPQTNLPEDVFNLGILGDMNEPLLAEAIAQIDALNRQAQPQLVKPAKNVIHKADLIPFGYDMYLNELPK
ncbi:S41 family peptidase [Aurantibacter aestuarii]|uniref:Peptidase S41 n=1 Tax=Aurantibacter aestuarii TaxID=1266046 RepID=A0A2T1N5F0_9FLAO|nr:S41 family peptidase [Aurantibacter aestuarii]PSG86494.1 peptidase S41 [Aurantibacter aestuarii]